LAEYLEAWHLFWPTNLDLRKIDPANQNPATLLVDGDERDKLDEQVEESFGGGSGI
jgi:hypothetical protein